MGTHLKVLCESYLTEWIPTWQGLDGFLESLRPCASEENSHSIGSVNPFGYQPGTQIMDFNHPPM